MTKRKFSGVLLLTLGGVLMLGGLIASSVELFNQAAPSDITPNSPSPSPNPLLVVSLPAPQSFVASPLLIRGKVYGPYEKVSLKLSTASDETLVDTLAFVQPSPDNPQAALFQSSLIFTKPSAATGQLTIQLLTNDDKIVDSQVIPIQFR